MAKSKDNSHTLTQEDINSFAAKLTKWAEELPESQQTIAQVLAEQAREFTPGRVVLDNIVTDLRAAFRKVITSINLDILGPTAGTWVRADPVWERKNKVEFGEDIEIIQRLFMTTKR